MIQGDFGWVHLIAGIVLGLTAGWNIAIHVWNHQARQMRQHDPLRLAARSIRVPHKVGDKVVGWREIHVVPDRDAPDA